ncbi:hypothetical protein BD626DRAFT_539205 [Schizophyllum amplum]|uniref:Uncharacterized protein n=1 Tax=Schizophyllum amplum TaxID=97359 RepID=A0A550C4L2_9AGAR|nr:hypothetical protein BD626DRAFT_539205 [Auriculariopsis ampla]
MPLSARTKVRDACAPSSCMMLRSARRVGVDIMARDAAVARRSALALAAESDGGDEDGEGENVELYSDELARPTSDLAELPIIVSRPVSSVTDTIPAPNASSKSSRVERQRAKRCKGRAELQSKLGIDFKLHILPKLAARAELYVASDTLGSDQAPPRARTRLYLPFLDDSKSLRELAEAQGLVTKFTKQTLCSDRHGHRSKAPLVAKLAVSLFELHIYAAA